MYQGINDVAGNADPRAFGSKQKLTTPYGIHTEIRKRSHVSRIANQVTNLSGSQQIDSRSLQGLSINQSAANFSASGNVIPHQNRKKLPIGFLVQQEKRELHKMGLSLHGNPKLRPDSAKVTLGSRSKVLLANEM